MLVRNNGISFRYIGRLLFLLQGSIWASVFNKAENIKISRKKLKNLNHNTGPVFIIGHWRTGSTFLHQLLSIDNYFSTPSVVKVSVPESFLVSEKYFRKIMSKVVAEKRPMDNVKLGPDEPQEDEYAIVKMNKNTALERIFFRRKKSDFLYDLKNFMENEKLSQKWKSNFSIFAAKLIYKDKNAIALFKNPFHSYRVETLKEMFPNAKFIHIHRNPLKVIPSTQRMWNIVGPQNLLAGKWQDVSIDNTIEMFNSLYNGMKIQLNKLSAEDFAEIRFEDLENDTINVLKSLYSSLNIKYTESFENDVKGFLDSLSSYKKNKYTLDDVSIKKICKGCEKFINDYNYEV